MEFSNDKIKCFPGSIKPAFSGQMRFRWLGAGVGEVLTGCLVKEMAEVSVTE